MGLASSRQRELRDPLVDGGSVYNFPGDRQKKRRSRNYPTDSNGVQFDPTCDKYDFLLVFPRPQDDANEAEGDRISWCAIETLWFQATPGDEDRKNAGIAWLKDEWVQRFRTDTVSSAEGGDTVPLTALQGLVREHVVDRLTACGLQLELTLSQDGSQVFCRVRAPMALLERKADELNHKLKLRGEVDPGPEFWRKSADQDSEGKPVFCEIVEESVLYEKNQANELLEDLYRAGKVGPNDASVFDEAEPSKKHWSRRVHTLERIADRVPVTNRFPAHADFVCQPEARHLYEEYPSVRGKTIFLPKDRLYLTSKILDEHFVFGVLVEHKVVEQCLALHDAAAGEALTLDWFSDHWVLFWRAPAHDCGAPRVSMPHINRGEPACAYWERPWAQPLMEIRAYFGEQVALYFAWLGFYGYALVTPTIVLTAAGLWEFVTGASADDEGASIAMFVQMLLAFFLVAWSAAYRDGWDAEQQWCATKWGTRDFEEGEQDRPQFAGDSDQPRRLSPISNQNETYYPVEKRARTQFYNALIVAFCGAFVLMTFALVFELEYKLTDVLPAALANYILPLIIALLIQWFSKLYNPIAYHLNESENYQTQTHYDNNLVLKVFAFEILNNYSSLAITAYFKGSYWGCVSGDGNCLADLKRLTGVIFGVRFGLALWDIVGGGCMGRAWKAFRQLLCPEDAVEEEDVQSSMHDVESDALSQLEHPAFVAEAELEAYNGLFDDYAEIVLQMGLVSMWSLGFYFMPLLAALEILLQMRVDAYGLVSDSQRPVPTPAETVGSWGTLMDTMSLLAVFTNAGIIVYTTKTFDKWTANEKLCAFFVIEQLLLLTKAVAHLSATGLPTQLKEIQLRQEHVVDRHRNCRFEEVFEDEDDEVDGLKRGHVDRSEVRDVSTKTDGLSVSVRARIAYLDEKLRACEADVTIARSQYRVACKTEVFNEEYGVSYSRRTPGLALGMVTLTVLEAENVGQRHDPVNPSSCRCVVHVRDPTTRAQRPYEGPPGPAPQVSKPAKKPPRSNELPEDLRSAGARMVFNQTFSLAPVKTSKAELFIEVMDHSKRIKRGSTTIALSDLSDQRKQALTLSILRPQATTTAQFGIPQEAAVLYVKAQFQYSRILPIKRRIYRLLEGRRKITQDRQNLRLGKAPEHAWDFPDDPAAPVSAPVAPPPAPAADMSAAEEYRY